MAENLSKKPPKSILKHVDETPSSTPTTTSERKDSSASKPAMTWDEMNIIATHHPADKDYGHMKIEESKTPFRHASEGNASGDEGGGGRECHMCTVSSSDKLAGGDMLNPDDLKNRLRAVESPSGDDVRCSTHQRRRASFSTETSQPGVEILEGGEVIQPGTIEAEAEENRPMTPEEREKHEQFKLKRQQHYNEGLKLKEAKRLLDKEGLAITNAEVRENTELNKEHLSEEPTEPTMSS